MDADKLEVSAGWSSWLRNRSCQSELPVGKLIWPRSRGWAGVDKPDFTMQTWGLGGAQSLGEHGHD